MPKKKPFLIQLLDMAKSYWPIILVISGIIGTIATIPSRLTAAEKEVEELKQNQQQFQDWVQAYEDTQKMIRKAPIGYRFDETVNDFVPWPDDPRRKRK